MPGPVVVKSSGGEKPPPETESASGLRLVGHSDLRGLGDGMQVLRHGEALYVGHAGSSGMGTSILDVSDPTKPQVVDQWPAPTGTRCPKVQVANGLLLVNHERYPPRLEGLEMGELPVEFSAGLLVFDLREPLAPRQVGRFCFAQGEGDGVHRVVWTGGRYAHASIFVDGRMDWMVLDMVDPTQPVEAARWKLDGHAPEGKHWLAHHALVADDRAYLGYWDAGMVVLDVADFHRPRMLSRLTWGGSHTHTCMPLPGRGLAVVTEEGGERSTAGRTYVRVVDISDPRAPRVVASCPEPAGDFRERDLRFGPHNLHENQLGSYQSERLVFVTYFNAGIRVYDLADAGSPVEVAHWLPKAPPGQRAAQLNDLYVEQSGLIWVTDRIGGGVYALEPEPALATLMRESVL